MTWRASSLILGLILREENEVLPKRSCTNLDSMLEDSLPFFSTTCITFASGALPSAGRSCWPAAGGWAQQGPGPPGPQARSGSAASSLAVSEHIAFCRSICLWCQKCPSADPEALLECCTLITRVNENGFDYAFPLQFLYNAVHFYLQRYLALLNWRKHMPGEDEINAEGSQR